MVHSLCQSHLGSDHQPLQNTEFVPWSTALCQHRHPAQGSGDVRGEKVQGSLPHAQESKSPTFLKHLFLILLGGSREQKKTWQNKLQYVWVTRGTSAGSAAGAIALLG